MPVRRTQQPLTNDLRFAQFLGQLYPMAIRVLIQRRHQPIGVADHP